MTRSVFIFTFSPVQPFIAQARRAADLYSGSQILVELAKAAAIGMQASGATLIYPASLDGDAPNRLVALTNDVATCLDAAQNGFQSQGGFYPRWVELYQVARQELQKFQPAPDAEWDAIWNRQVSHLWETYWSAAEMSADDFHSAYQNARQALEAVKRTRAFPQVDEDGLKDSLSGERSSLRVKGQDGRQYWAEVATSPKVSPAQLKPEGRERLDAISAVKRFGKLEPKKKKQIQPFNGFPSTSTIAALPYLRQCRKHQPLLQKYAREVRSLGCFPVRDDNDWPFDGDLFFQEILDPRRLKDDYHITKNNEELNNARNALAALYGEAGRPSAYYAIISLDGDSLGKRINACQSVDEAEKLSTALTNYAKGIRASMDYSQPETEPDIYVIYNGGDDLLAMTPLENAFQTAREWKNLFQKEVGKYGKELVDEKTGEKEKVGYTASAGIAIVHHQAPLSASLRAARNALDHAKKLKGKDAVCIQVLKRSGAPVEILSRWDDIGGLFEQVFADFSAPDDKTKSALSSKFAFNVLEEASTTNALPLEARQSALRRLLKRNSQDDKRPPQVSAEALAAWAAKLDQHHAKQQDGQGNPIHQGMTALGNWLVAIRFIVQGGGE